MLTTAARSYTPSIRIRSIVALPFTHRYTAPLWLGLRLYLAYLWLNFGLQKLEAGWLTTDPIGGMLKLVGNGTLPVPFEFYRGVAQFLVNSGMTPLLSHSMPFLELAVALSFASGVLVVPAAIGAILLNTNFILSGIGQVQYDGRFIALQLLLILAFRVVGLIGFQKLLVRVVFAAYRMIRPARHTVRA